MSSEKILGIDLGTTNSSAAVVEGGKPMIIPSAEGPTLSGKMFPSVVSFTKEGDVLIGEPARRQASTNPKRTIQHIKRKMGTGHKVKIDGKEYTPQQISAFVLQKIKRDAEHFLGEKVGKAVITVPAYFNDNQRTATKDAGTIAGLEVVRIINEPTAAALAYGLDKESRELNIAVLDLGGGTFDVTIMQMGDGVFQVKSTSGDTQLGGKDMDEAIMDWIISEFKKKEDLDISKDHSAMQRVREGAEKAKIELSNVPSTTINLPFITARGSEPVHLELELKRSKLEELVARFEPYGQANPELRFLARNMVVEEVQIIGRDQRHVKLLLAGGGYKWPAVYWNAADRAARDFHRSDRVDIVFEFTRNHYNGNNTVQLVIVDLVRSPEQVVEGDGVVS